MIELLVAITLMSLLTVALFAGLRFGARAAGAASTQLDRSGQLATAQGFLLAALQGAQSAPQVRAPDPRYRAFDGGPDHMDFMVVPPAYLAIGGLQRLHVGLEPEPNGTSLALHWQTITGSTAVIPRRSVRSSRLIDGVSSASFSYFGVRPPADTSQWHAEWHDASALPRLVRLSLVLADGSRLPEIVVAPRQAGLFEALPP